MFEVIFTMIEVKEVSFSYGTVQALDDISFTIKSNESIGIKGPSACGKSTLIKLLNGIVFADKGSYLFNGHLINKEIMKNHTFSKWMHQKMGVVFQNPDSQLFCNNVYEEVSFGPIQMGLSDIDIKNRTEDCLNMLGIDEIRYRVPYHLSQGEKRRVAIASMLSMNPDILILDEPLNDLDKDWERWLTDFLICLKLAGKTLIISTHNEEFLKIVCTRILTMDKNHKLYQ